MAFCGHASPCPSNRSFESRRLRETSMLGPRALRGSSSPSRIGRLHRFARCCARCRRVVWHGRDRPSTPSRRETRLGSQRRSSVHYVAWYARTEAALNTCASNALSRSCLASARIWCDEHRLPWGSAMSLLSYLGGGMWSLYGGQGFDPTAS